MVYIYINTKKNIVNSCFTLTTFMDFVILFNRIIFNLKIYGNKKIGRFNNFRPRFQG